MNLCAALAKPGLPPHAPLPRASHMAALEAAVQSVQEPQGGDSSGDFPGCPGLRINFVH